MTKMTDMFDQNDRYRLKWPLSITKMTVIFLFDNTSKMTVIHRIQKITVILVLNDQNDRYTKSEIIGNFCLK